MLCLNNVSKHFAGMEKGVLKKAVNEVSLSIQPNEIFALIGESGSGKSTLAEMIIGLQKPTNGTIEWSASVQLPTKKTPVSLIQVVFQNPDRSMNPYWRVKDIIAEPLRLHGYPKKEAYVVAEEFLRKVKLSADFLERYPAECSGGQKQRIAIARALTMSPMLLVADEITSALDPSIEAEILQLLLSLKQTEGMSILYITHRLETIEGFADRVAVMRHGEIQEYGMAADVLAHPQSDYTKALLQAATFA